METNLRFFDISTFKRSSFRFFVWRNGDLLSSQSSEYQRVPECNSPQSVFIVDSTHVSQSEYQTNQTKFILKPLKEFNVTHVVVNELLKIIVIQFLKSAVIFKFLLTKDQISNEVQTIALLSPICVEGELLKQGHVV